jgi:capsid protein
VNNLDKLIGYFSPGAAVKREGARKVLGYYEAAEPSRMRNFYRSRGTQNELMQRSAVAIRTQTRHLIRNHDLARGALRTLVNNVVGAKGIGVEPQPRNNDG